MEKILIIEPDQGSAQDMAALFNWDKYQIHYVDEIDSAQELVLDPKCHPEVKTTGAQKLINPIASFLPEFS